MLQKVGVGVWGEVWEDGLDAFSLSNSGGPKSMDHFFPHPHPKVSQSLDMPSTQCGFNKISPSQETRNK